MTTDCVHRLAVYFVVVALALVVVGCQQGPEQPVSQTYRYAPSAPEIVLPPSEENSCWIGSIASARLDAFRCRIGNRIHDPCFTYGRETMVCPLDPRTTADDVAFTFDPFLTVPPDPFRTTLEERAWFMVVNGRGCYASTGTRLGVGGKYYDFPCFDVFCTEPREGFQGFVSDCWDPDTGLEKPVIVDAVWY